MVKSLGADPNSQKLCQRDDKVFHSSHPFFLTNYEKKSCPKIIMAHTQNNIYP